MLVRRLIAYVASIWIVVAVADLPLQAQYQQFEGQRIANIQFDPKDQPLEASELHEILPLKVDQPLRISDVRAAIDRLFATGRYADIQVDAEPYNGGVLIRFVTQNSWFIGRVSVDGMISSPPNAGQLENAAQLDLGQPYTQPKLQDAIAGQLRLFENNGLYKSEVHPALDWDYAYQQVHIRFNDASGQRAHFTTPVLTGNLALDPARIIGATKFQRWLIHTWKPVTQTRVRQGLSGVRSLYEKESRLEAKISVSSMKYDVETNSAIPTLQIDAGPRIVVRTFGANLSQKALRRYVPIYEEHTVDYDLLSEGARNLQDYFQSQGYFDAAVEFKEQQVTNDQATIDYLVATGKRHRVVAIRIAGNHYFNSAAIRERMFLQPARFLQFPHGRYSAGLLAQDEDSIKGLYQTNGFRDVAVTHQIEDDYRGKPGDIAITLTIAEGPQYFVNHLDVAGIEKLNKESILAKLSSVSGQPFSDFNVAVDRDTILAQYFQNGFPNATFEWSSTPAAEPHRVDLHYTVSEGQEQFVREVVPMGLHVTRPDLVNRQITLNPGDPLSPTEVTAIQHRLYDLGVFSKVDAAIQDPDGETTRKYVLYDMEEAHRWSIAPGFGAELGRIGGCSTCFDAPAGATGFSPRVSLDVARNNLWGLGHTISLRTRASTLDQRALLNYSFPRFEGNPNLNISFTGLYEASRDVRTFNYKREEGSTQLSQRVNKSLTFFYRLTYRRVSISDLKITQFLLPQLTQPVRVGLASWSMVQDRRDDPVEPHRGIYNTIDLSMATHVLGSQVNFGRFLVRNSTYHPIGKRWVFARSTQLGIIRAFPVTGTSLDAVPLPERFFSGGANSDRGFPEEQAGPRDPSTGFPLGGTALFFNQHELRFPLIGDNIGGVLYHDMGNVYSAPENFSFRTSQHSLQDFNYMVHAVGFGVRYRTPVGPVRVDLGYSINPPYFFGWNGTQQDLISAGTDPCKNVPAKCTVQNVSHFQFFFSIGQTF